MGPEQRYDVVISYAGEDRQYAEALAEVLQRLDVVFFYDKYEKAELWGKNLYTHLSNVYQNQAHYCVMFLSQHYAKKVWTNHEREAAQARAFREHEEYILPIRLDDTVIPEILPTIDYLEWSKETPETIAEAILSKLKKASPHRGLLSHEPQPAKDKKGVSALETDYAQLRAPLTNDSFLFRPNSKPDFNPQDLLSPAQKHSLESKPVRRIVTPIELKTVWNRFVVMNIDYQLHRINLIDSSEVLNDGLGDGYLHRDGLMDHIEKIQRKRANERERGCSTEYTDKDLEKARTILREMDEVGASAIDYLPQPLKDFPDRLRRVATELLMEDDTDNVGEIEQVTIDNARSRYDNIPERSTSEKRKKESRLKDINELAKKLGFF